MREEAVVIYSSPLKIDTGERDQDLIALAFFICWVLLVGCV